MARELAISYDVPFTDPADAGLPADVDGVSDAVWPASIEDPTACDRFVLREVRGIDPAAPTPLRMRVRLARAGQRSVSLAVDVTNYLMLELGQPLHAFDRARLSGPIVVRRARPGERLETLDHVVRDLDPEDILITDASGPISLAGTMGGLATEVTRGLARPGHRGRALLRPRHRPDEPPAPAVLRGVGQVRARASTTSCSCVPRPRPAVLLAALGGGTIVPGVHLRQRADPAGDRSRWRPTTRTGSPAWSTGSTRSDRRLRQVGCTVTLPAGRRHGPARPVLLTVVPPSWRPDLTDPADLAEEVIRLEGYEHIPVSQPRAAAGRGLTARQRLRRHDRPGAGRHRVTSRCSASPFAVGRRLRPAAAARRRSAAAGAGGWPTRSATTSRCCARRCCPDCCGCSPATSGRGFADVALFETGAGLPAAAGRAAAGADPPVDRRAGCGGARRAGGRAA